jgi:hypothetical protein
LSMSLVTEVQNNAAALTLLREKGRALETAIARGVPEKLVSLTAGKRIDKTNKHTVSIL